MGFVPKDWTGVGGREAQEEDTVAGRQGAGALLALSRDTPGP